MHLRCGIRRICYFFWSHWKRHRNKKTTTAAFDIIETPSMTSLNVCLMKLIIRIFLTVQRNNTPKENAILRIFHIHDVTNVRDP